MVEPSPKPNVVVSKCLGFEAVRYDGQKLQSIPVRRMRSHVNFITVCPEVEIGLGVPRPKVRLVKNKTHLSLVEPSGNIDLTGKIQSFSRTYLTSLNNVDGFILKSRSPSCGIRNTKIYRTNESESYSQQGTGFFAEAVIKAYPALAIEDESRLDDPDLFDHFLTKLFAIARCRVIKSRLSIPLLKKFHADNELLYKAYNLAECKYLNRIVGAAEKNPCEMLRSEYERHFHHLIAKRPKFTSHVRVMEKTVEKLWPNLRGRDKPIISTLLQRYSDRDLPLPPLRMAVRELATKFGDPTLKRQSYLRPYPVPLEIIPEH